MKSEKVNKLQFGLYRIHWKKSCGGGTSLCSVGQTYSGKRWMAPCNWTIEDKYENLSAGTSSQKRWDAVLEMELILADHENEE